MPSFTPFRHFMLLCQRRYALPPCSADAAMLSYAAFAITMPPFSRRYLFAPLITLTPPFFAYITPFRHEFTLYCCRLYFHYMRAAATYAAIYHDFSYAADARRDALITRVMPLCATMMPRATIVVIMP